MSTDTLTPLPPIVDPVQPGTAVTVAPSTTVATVKEAAVHRMSELATAAKATIARFTNLAHDLTTPAGLEAAKKDLNAYRRQGRFLIQNERDDLKKQLNEAKGIVVNKAEEIIALLEPLETAMEAPITAREAVLAAEEAERQRKAEEEAERQRKAEEEAERQRQAEALRVVTLKGEIDGLYASWVSHCKIEGITPERIAIGISKLEVLPMPEAWAELQVYADRAKTATLLEMRRLHQVCAEALMKAQADELAALRAAAAAAAAPPPPPPAPAPAPVEAPAPAPVAQAPAPAAAQPPVRYVTHTRAAPAPAPAATPAAPAAPVAAPAALAPVTPDPMGKPTAQDLSMLSMAEVRAKLAPLSITAEGLEELGVKPTLRRGQAILFLQSDMSRIAAALIKHLEGVR